MPLLHMTFLLFHQEVEFISLLSEFGFGHVTLVNETLANVIQEKASGIAFPSYSPCPQTP